MQTREQLKIYLSTGQFPFDPRLLKTPSPTSNPMLSPEESPDRIYNYIQPHQKDEDFYMREGIGEGGKRDAGRREGEGNWEEGRREEGRRGERRREEERRDEGRKEEEERREDIVKYQETERYFISPHTRKKNIKSISNRLLLTENPGETTLSRNFYEKFDTEPSYAASERVFKWQEAVNFRGEKEGGKRDEGGRRREEELGRSGWRKEEEVRKNEVGGGELKKEEEGRRREKGGGKKELDGYWGKEEEGGGRERRRGGGRWKDDEEDRSRREEGGGREEDGRRIEPFKIESQSSEYMFGSLKRIINGGACFRSNDDSKGIGRMINSLAKNVKANYYKGVFKKK